MVEPPRHTRRRRVFEINDGILVAVEHLFVEERVGPVEQPAIGDFSAGANLRAVEARENGGGSDAVETVAVVEQA